MSIEMKKTLEQIRIHTQEKEMKRRMLRDLSAGAGKRDRICFQ